MSAHDPRPSAPRPRRLVLRKIQDGTYLGPAATSSKSSLTPLPMVRPPPRPSSPVLPETYALDSAALAAMTPPAPRAAELQPRPRPASVRTPLPSTTPAPDPQFYAPARSYPPASTPVGERNPRNSVAPVVASLPPHTAAFIPSALPTRARFSADSKLLAGGGALAATMLALAVGVFLGKGSARSAASAASAPASYTAAVETPAVVVFAPPPVVVRAAVPAQPTVETMAIAATIDVQQLPVAPRPRVRPWVVATAKVPNAGGWTVAAPQAGSTPASAAKPSVSPPPADPPAVEANEAPEVPATTAAAVDPLVQAVREDIREDESTRSSR
jgi:hypothetical protein